MRGALTKEQAISAMKKGSKVSHTNFTGDEWMRLLEGMHNEVYEFEDECLCEVKDFWSIRSEPIWQDNWYLVN